MSTHKVGVQGAVARSVLFFNFELSAGGGYINAALNTHRCGNAHVFQYPLESEHLLSRRGTHTCTGNGIKRYQVDVAQHSLQQGSELASMIKAIVLAVYQHVLKGNAAVSSLHIVSARLH